MSATPESFARDLARFGAKLTAVLEDVHKETAIEYRLRVAGKTPILTGRHAASWNASVGAPNPAVKSGSYNDPSGATEDGQVDVESFTLGETLFVSNAGPAIEELNAGSSHKAPAGFIEATVQEIETVLPAIVSKVRQTHGL